MIYACGEPVNHTFQASNGEAIDYTIRLNGTAIFNGQIIPYNATLTEVTIDISEVLQEYLETFYEQIPPADLIAASVPVYDGMGTLYTFVVASDSNPNDGADRSYTVGYNYNFEYVSELPDLATINDPVLLDADPRQYVYICGYNANGGANTYRYRVNGGAWTSRTITSTQYQVFGVKLDSLTLNDGDTVEIAHVETDTSFAYRIVPRCRNRYVLYYVNRAGGLDSMLCSGRDVRSFSPTRTDVKLYHDRSKRREWQNKRIYQEVERRWELNTRLLTDNEADNIDQLIYSPKVWIHDLEADTITSVLIRDTDYTINTFKNNRVFGYTINVAESRDHVIK